MKSMKKILAMILCLMLVLPVSALAAKGDAIVARRDMENYTNGFQDYISQVVEMDGVLYLVGDSGIYTYHVGDADVVKAYQMDGTMPKEYLDVPEGGQENNYFSTRYGVFAMDGELYMLALVSHSWVEDEAWHDEVQEEAVLMKLALREDGTAAYEVVEEYDWTDMIVYEGDYSYGRQCNGSLFVDGKLFIRSYDDSYNEAMYVFDLESGEVEQLDDLSGMVSMCAYKEGQLLLQQYSYEKPTEAKLMVYDIASGDLEELRTLTIPEYSYLRGVLYDETSDTMVYCRSGAIWAMNLADGTEQEICDMPFEAYSEQMPLLLNGQYYVFSSYQGVVVRNIRPAEDEKAAYTLRIYNGAYANAVNNAYYDFANANGDAMVIMSTDYMQDTQVLEDMMNRSDNWDVYVLSRSSQAYDAIYNRGYQAEMTGSQVISDLVSSFYPSVQGQLKRGEDIVVVPVEAYGYTMGVNAKGFEKLNLTVDDIPHDWVGFLNFLANDLPGLMPDDGTLSLFDGYTDANSARYQLFGMILDDYQKYLEYSGIEQGYNTEMLSSILNLLDQVDFVALGQPEEIDWDNYNWEWNEASYLVSYSMDCTPSSYYPSTENVLLPLSMTADTPFIISLASSMVFVNPFSKHVDKAIEFVEKVAQGLSYNVTYSLNPAMDQPIRSSYYEEAKVSAEEYLENLREQYENAEEVDKQQIEEELKSYEEYMKDFESYYWDVSAQGIEWYHAHDDLVRLSGYNMMYGGTEEASEEIWNLRTQYMERTITADEFLKGIDKKLQMMILENQ